MAERAHIRGVLAAVVTLALAAGAAPFAGVGVGPAAAAPAAGYDVVIPAVNKPVLADRYVTSAGSHGYFRVFDGVGQWVPYESGTPRTAAGSGGVPLILPDGSERFAEPWAGTIRLTDPAAGTSTNFALPHGYSFAAAIGTSEGWAAIATAEVLNTDGNVIGKTVHLLTFDAGATTFVDRPVTGLPADGQYRATMLKGETAARVVVATTSDSGMALNVVDLADAATVHTTQAPSGVTFFSNSHSFGWYSTGTLTLHSLADPAAAPRTVSLPAEANAGSTAYDITLTDSALLAVRKGSTWNDGRADPLYSVPLDGGPVTEPLPDASAPHASGDAGAYVSGGTDADHWDTYRIAPSGGTPVALFHNRILRPVRYGLTLGHGRLAFMEGREDNTGAVYAALYHQDEGVGPVPQPTSAPYLSSLGGAPVSSCATPGHCTAGLAMGSDEYTLSWVEEGADGKDTVRAENNTMLGGVPVDSSGGRIVDASEWTTIYNSGSNGRQYIVSPGYRKVVMTRPIVPAALWGDTLWSATGTKGQLAQTDLVHNSSAGPVTRPSLTTDAPCAIKEVQALGRWLYWSCGASGPAGVYDRTAKKSVRVPAGPALLGDGFVLRHPGDQLQLTDIRPGTAGATRTLAALPADPALPDTGRGNTWTLDKFRGAIAYTTADAATHLVSPVIAPAPVNAAWSDVRVQSWPRDGGYGDWSGEWLLSGAVSGWKLEIRSMATGALQATRSGGATRSSIYANWNGRDANGVYATDGGYRWTLTTTAANGVSQGGTTASGVLYVYGGRPTQHSLTAGGSANVLGVTPAGVLRLYQAAANGTLNPPQTADHGWPTTATYLAFGDLDNNGYGNLLVRTSDGKLRSYPGDGEGSFLRSDPSRLIGPGWNIYNTLLAPGDLTGDGRPDLLARTPSGDLYLYADNGSGAFRARVKIGYGFGIFSTMTGVGDLTGDGTGDLVARDRSGVLWRYAGDGKGRLKARVRVGPGWNTYTALVGPGDLNRDGRADLVARDASGVLWRYFGTSGGQFGPRVRIGGGWDGYRLLF
ncbi:Repeat domain-containing protein [Actinacidiphila alni]|uniref:Repeat domain-containing protein n=1 Tax=Actinacidiphila alni TaxID=380248 RepID=A0A1I2JDS5_9ACTN|nr:VCBS repeat-containing protein [Actinacidiphila alni]SFF52003.1 Repeat domain-containing protein [Actinacidiphila alni]